MRNEQQKIYHVDKPIATGTFSNGTFCEATMTPGAARLMDGLEDSYRHTYPRRGFGGAAGLTMLEEQHVALIMK